MTLQNRTSLFVMLIFSLSTLSIAANRAGSGQVSEKVEAQALVNYGKLPLSFQENRGQTDARVKFLSHGNRYSIRLAPSEVLLNLHGKAGRESTIRMGFPGAKSSPVMAGAERQRAVSSYFIGNDPAKWVTGAPNFARVQYRQLYPGIDLAFYGNQGQLEYDFVVAPGADPGAIRLQFDGVDGMHLDRAGDLVLSAANGAIRQHKPIVYQEGAGGRQMVEGRYVIQSHNRVAFEIAGYDKRKALVVDPTLSFATYLGSPGDELFNTPAAASTATYPAVAVDSQGNVYVAGYMGGNVADFPGHPGILTAGGKGGGTDVFVVKMNQTGTALIYSVVFGGELSDVAGGIAVDIAGNAYVTGYTNSTLFPVAPNAPQSSLPSASTNAFATEVNASGTALVYSTYLGGSGSFWGRGIAVDPSGNAYVTGTAEQSGSTPFPLVNPLSSTPSAGFLTEVNAAGTAFVYSTYLSAGIGYGIAVDSGGDAYVTGTTGNGSLPSPAQGYVLKVNAGGSAVGYEPFFFGTSGTPTTIGFGIALDAQKDAFVTGMTNDPAFPQITAGAPQTSYGGGLTDGFALKLNPAGNAVLYATYIGGLGSNPLPERGSGIAVDSAGNAFVAGTTQCVGFPVANQISGARNGGPAVLMKGTVNISTASSNWVPTTLAGSFDQVDALAFDPSGNLYAGASALNATGGGIYLSTDGGNTWVPTAPLSNGSVVTTTTVDSIAVDPNAPGTVYAAGSGNLYQTTDGGGLWKQLSQAVGPSAAIAIAKTGSSSSIVYVGSSTGLIYSTNSGTSWTPPTAAPGTGAVSALIVDPNNALTAYAGTPTGVYQTVNGGANWVAVNNGLPGGGVTSLAINGAAVYATVVHAVIVTENGLYYTTNASTNGWTQATLGENTSAPLLVAVDSGNNVYVAFSGGGLATGTSGGTQADNWSLPTSAYNGLTHNQITALAVPPGGNGTAFAGIVAAITAFVTEINPTGTAPFSSSTCIGGSDNSLGQSIAVTPGGTVMSGATIATDFPATRGVVQTANAGSDDAFAVGINFDTGVTLTSSPSGAAITVAGGGCAPGSYTTPAPLIWSLGSVCTISFTDPQTIGGVSYEFKSSTVNGSAISHTNPLTVSSSGGALAISATFATVSGTSSGGATHFSVTAPANATAGIPIQFTVTALNSSNQTVTAYTDPVHFTSTDPSAALPGDATLTNGVGTFSASLVTVGSATLTASDLLSPTITGTSGSIGVSQPAAGLQFFPMTPCRVVDTRDSTKPSGFGPPSISGETSRSFAISSPSAPCGIPASAQAYSLNVTVVPHGTLGYITVWPTGQSQPVVSTLNSIDGEVKANAAIVPAGTGGAISVFATNDTDVVLDINGYFLPPNTVSNELAFYPMAPCRLVDTRPGAPSTVSTGALAPYTSRTLPLLSSSCNVPSTAQAYSLNFTLVPPGPVGYLTVYPTGGSLPIVSTVNDPTGTVEANAGIAPAGTDGSIDVLATNTTDLVVDINGYFAPPGEGGLSLYTFPTCRALDTRNPTGAPPFNGTINVAVIGSGCGGTSAVEAYVLNATVVPQGFLGYLTLWPEGSARPVVSTLNAYNGQVTSNMAIVPTSNTEISAFADDNTFLVLDISGYFAP
jgi:hypothetical protein